MVEPFNTASAVAEPRVQPAEKDNRDQNDPEELARRGGVSNSFLTTKPKSLRSSELPFQDRQSQSLVLILNDHEVVEPFNSRG